MKYLYDLLTKSVNLRADGSYKKKRFYKFIFQQWNGTENRIFKIRFFVYKLKSEH